MVLPEAFLRVSRELCAFWIEGMEAILAITNVSGGTRMVKGKGIQVTLEAGRLRQREGVEWVPRLCP